MENYGFNHGTAVLEKEIATLKVGDWGVITAYLPEMEKFAVYFTNGNWITFTMTENEFLSYFVVQLHDCE